MPSSGSIVAFASAAQILNLTEHCVLQVLVLKLLLSIELKQVDPSLQQQYGVALLSGIYFKLKSLSYRCSCTDNWKLALLSATCKEHKYKALPDASSFTLTYLSQSNFSCFLHVCTCICLCVICMYVLCEHVCSYFKWYTNVYKSISVYELHARASLE